VPIKDPHKIRKLNRRFTKAQAKAKAEEEKERREKEAAEQREYEEEGESTKGKQDKDRQTSDPDFATRRLTPISGPKDESAKFDWEVVSGGERYLHKKGKEPKHGWYRVVDGGVKRVKRPRNKEILGNEITDFVARTKWGTRVYSNDGKHYFNVGVWKSRGYPGCTTIRLSVAGKNYMYTLDETYMRAVRAELSRGMPT
jgi:hypothetical protein